MTSALTKYEIRLNLIDLMVDYVNEAYRPPVPDGEQEPLLNLLRIYRADTVRRMTGQPGTLEFLMENLKVGIRPTNSLL